MINESVSIDQVIQFLNELKDIDNEFLCRLINLRVQCNDSLLNHPTVQCAKYKDERKGRAGFLGVLNGLFGINDETGWGIINAIGEFDESDKTSPLLKFTKIINIQKTDFEKIKKQQAQLPIMQEIR